jgi:hypothetical protein
MPSPKFRFQSFAGDDSASTSKSKGAKSLTKPRSGATTIPLKSDLALPEKADETSLDPLLKRNGRSNSTLIGANSHRKLFDKKTIKKQKGSDGSPNDKATAKLKSGDKLKRKSDRTDSQDKPKRDSESLPAKQREKQERDNELPPGKWREKQERDSESSPGKQREKQQRDNEGPPGKQREKQERDNESPHEKQREKQQKDNELPAGKWREKQERDSESSPGKQREKQQRDNEVPPGKQREKQERDNESPHEKQREKHQRGSESPPGQLGEKEKGDALGFADSGVGRDGITRPPKSVRRGGMAQAAGFGIVFGATTGIVLVAGVFYLGQRKRVRGQERCEDNRPLLGTDDFSL